ncbi:hypothetical protein EYC84_006098 [Monilinia fructicola]|uniref:Uncharacterized protein n=1 Tax=Monilinia fructicola TaxID=38448 RepID=A0A5M9K5Q9_MONFR|nr:hypothetical protein EYC84_006098 [Monilinia fructicola]
MLPLKRIPLSLPRPARPALLSLSRTSPQRTRQFTSTPQTQDQNRIYTPVRYPRRPRNLHLSTSTSTAKRSSPSGRHPTAPLARRLLR